MDATPWLYSFGAVAKYVKERTRTPEDVEKEIEDLKKRLDAHFDYELLDRTIYTLNSSIIWHEASAKNLEIDLKSLENIPEQHKGTDWVILTALFKGRLEHDKNIIEEHKKLLIECTEKAKAYAFEVRSKELREELAELKELAAPPEEEPKES